MCILLTFKRLLGLFLSLLFMIYFLSPFVAHYYFNDCSKFQGNELITYEFDVKKEVEDQIAQKGEKASPGSEEDYLYMKVVSTFPSYY